MPTFLNSYEVLDLTSEIPLYLFHHLEKPAVALTEELVHFVEHRMSLEHDTDPLWDLRIANALAVIGFGRHPEALEMLVEAYHWVQGNSPFLQHKILRLIERLLDAQTYAPLASRWLPSLRPRDPLYVALLTLSARAPEFYPTTRSHLMRLWAQDAMSAARIIGQAKKREFLPMVESELKNLAPYLKYLPVLENQRPLYQHELWSELSEAWFAIYSQFETIPSWLDPKLTIFEDEPQGHLYRHQEWLEQLDAHLMERFGSQLPTHGHEWLESLTEEESHLRDQFLAAESFQNEVSRPGPRKLRLVETPSSI